MILKKSDALKIEVNTKNNYGYTAFHLACQRGHANVAKMIMANSAALKIDLNTKSEFGDTPYNSACYKGHTKVVHLMLDQSKTLSIDLTAEDNLPPMRVVNLIKEKMPSLVE